MKSTGKRMGYVFKKRTDRLYVLHLSIRMLCKNILQINGNYVTVIVYSKRSPYEREFEMQEILQFIKAMLPTIRSAIPIYLVGRFMFYLIMRRRGFKTNFRHELLLLIFVLFMAGLASQTVISQNLIQDGIAESGELRVNLTPFHKLTEIQTALQYNNVHYILIEVFGNIAMFAVIGFLLPLLWSEFESFKNIVLISFTISLVIETTQLFLPRVTDVDDLIMNTLGGVIGYMIYRIGRRIFPNVIKTHERDF